ncbi:MAG: response regulator transcription factor [Verrucomicrobiaceae bacterium]|nr:response regulator transcription factor [Verrucomicrobiaceae bacterium]
MNEETILIVEDDPAILFGLRDNFERAGYNVRTAVEGRLGLDLARSLKPALILLDIMLPGMDGFTICQTLRKEGLEMPVIMLTALGQEEQIIKGLNLGADDYVTKPFSIHQLMARVTSMLRRHRRTVDEVVKLTACEVNRTTREVRNAQGHIVELTPKEHGVLDYFLSHPHRPLTRDQILDAVWGTDVFVTDRSVDRTVTTLRQKIEANPSRPDHIRTVQKVGYRFETEASSAS